jgi:hypothetical protein
VQIAGVSRRLLELHALLGGGADVDVIWMVTREPQLLTTSRHQLMSRLMAMRVSTCSFVFVWCNALGYSFYRHSCTFTRNLRGWRGGGGEGGEGRSASYDVRLLEGLRAGVSWLGWGMVAGCRATC